MKKEDKELNKIFSSNIKYLISRSGKKQQDVAAELGVPRTTFNNWCVGKVLPSLPKLRALAEYFHVEEDALVRPLVGNSIMFSMQLTGEELDLVESFRAAAPTERSRAVQVLKAKEDLPFAVAALRPEMDRPIGESYAEELQKMSESIVPDVLDVNALIARTKKAHDELDKALDKAIARVKAASPSGISEELRERQRKQAAEFAALKAGKKEGTE